MNALIAVTGLGVLTMLAEIFSIRKIVSWLVIPGIILSLVFCFFDWGSSGRYFNDMVYWDNYALAFAGVLMVISLLWFILAGPYYNSKPTLADSYAIILFALAGALIMVCYANLAMLFIGIEILSISFYVLAASNKSELRSNEAGLKYFLIGAFSSGFLLFGIALIYGASATFNMQSLTVYVTTHQGSLPGIFYAGMLLMLVGMTFKVAAVPFHSWAPDVYEGAPTLITALMSTVVKTAAFAALYRLFGTCFAPISTEWSGIIWIMAAASMLAGNILAVAQNSLKRMLAYSSISHAGYMLLAVLAVNDLSAPAILLYAAAYSVASICAFTVLQQVSIHSGDESIAGLKGFAKAHPVQAFILILTMLSMAGIPPVAGFFAKYYVFYAALKSQYTGLVVIAVVSSLIGVYYYLRVVFTLFQETGNNRHSYAFGRVETFLLSLGGLLILLLGLMPNLLTGLLS